MKEQSLRRSSFLVVLCAALAFVLLCAACGTLASSSDGGGAASNGGGGATSNGGGGATSNGGGGATSNGGGGATSNGGAGGGGGDRASSLPPRELCLVEGTCNNGVISGVFGAFCYPFGAQCEFGCREQPLPISNGGQVNVWDATVAAQYASEALCNAPDGDGGDGGSGGENQGDAVPAGAGGA